MKNSVLLILLITLLDVPSSDSFLIFAPCKKLAAATTIPLTIKSADEASQHQYATAAEKFDAKWNVMFERLKEYKEEYGDCLVPTRYEKDPKLGQWVATLAKGVHCR